MECPHAFSNHQDISDEMPEHWRQTADSFLFFVLRDPAFL